MIIEIRCVVTDPASKVIIEIRCVVTDLASKVIIEIRCIVTDPASKVIIEIRCVVTDPASKVIIEIRCIVTDPASKVIIEIRCIVTVPASKVIIDELKKQYMVGDKISCSGDGNPTPEAKWSTDSEEANDEAISGNVLTILEDLVGKTVTYTCTLSNDLGGESGLLKDTFTFSVVGEYLAAQWSSVGPISGTVGAAIYANLVVQFKSWWCTHRWIVSEVQMRASMWIGIFSYLPITSEIW